MSDFGIKVSIAGKSISSTEPRDYVLNSKFISAVIYKEAEVSVTIGANSTAKSTVLFYYPDDTTRITFPYIPVVYIMAQLVSSVGKWYSSPFAFTQGLDIDSPQETGILSAYATDTSIEADKFYITFYNRTGSSKTIKYHYYIFANLAA